MKNKTPLTKEEIKFLNNNILKLSVGNILELNNDKAILEGDIITQKSFYLDCSKLNDSELTFKYFKNVFPNIDFNNNGSFVDMMYRTTVIELITKDLGSLTLIDTIDKTPILFPKYSKQIDIILDKFNRYENILYKIFEYYYENHNDKFRNTKTEAFLDVPNISIL